jgi:hypothetical protein
MRKSVILLLVFLLPVSVFLFLRYFGKNEFDIPVLYADKVDIPSNCNISLVAPYLVPDSVVLQMNGKGKALLVLDSGVTQKDISVITENFDRKDVELFFLSSLEKERANRLKNCVVFLSSPRTAVLIDGARQIRGYYILPNRDELDKLDVELKILLKKY